MTDPSTWDRDLWAKTEYRRVSAYTVLTVLSARQKTKTWILNVFPYPPRVLLSHLLPVYSLATEETVAVSVRICMALRIVETDLSGK